VPAETGIRLLGVNEHSLPRIGGESNASYMRLGLGKRVVADQPGKRVQHHSISLMGSAPSNRSLPRRSRGARKPSEIR
jgi:hypothetical protein